MAFFLSPLKIQSHALPKHLKDKNRFSVATARTYQISVQSHVSPKHMKNNRFWVATARAYPISIKFLEKLIESRCLIYRFVVMWR